MNKILKLSAWKIFIVLMITIIIGGSIDSSWGMLISGIALIGWMYLLGMATNQLTPSLFRFSIPLFTFRLLFALIYILILSMFTNQAIPVYLIPIHIIASLFIFSCLWTCAKTIVVAETQKIHSFDKYIGTFLLLWFFPIGIWFIQPRLNRL
jgi:hypothetical protein